MYRFFSSALIASALVLAPVSAATLTITQGSANVNRGQGYEAVSGTATVNPGDVVNVPPGGSAQIVYADGSIQTVRPGNIASVGAGQSAPASGSATVTQAAGTPGAGGAGATEGVTDTTLAVGAVVLGIGIGVAVYAAQGKGANKGASP